MIFIVAPGGGNTPGCRTAGTAVQWWGVVILGPRWSQKVVGKCWSNGGWDYKLYARLLPFEVFLLSVIWTIVGGCLGPSILLKDYSSTHSCLDQGDTRERPRGGEKERPHIVVIHFGHGNLYNIVTLIGQSESTQLNVYPRLWFSWDLAVASSLLAHICLYIGLKNHYHSECLSTVIVSHWAVKRQEQRQWMAVWISIVSDLREEEK